MKKALVNIDYTNDFVNGALPVGQPALQVEKEIVTITKRAYENGDFIVFAIDLHEHADFFHPETTLFPPHNLRGTNGRELYGELAHVYNTIKASDQICWIDKTRYSAFAGTNLDIKLRERNITEIELVGVCTDICVLHTAIDAYNHGYKVTVYTDAVASFNEAGHQFALQHIRDVLNGTIL
ncbi:cysteine hydrolase family protein [Bacillus alkalicellulosilyticus]|uniref:cysteine hydrolase family protein n=1 Tax=Alkalihalobacterium alkalicellulosilyticum TaxID=1912214 RepID=UPI0009981982|nr:isochorismatase family cysteine hydrolase [Bacillus alkalicellulosilyticus]